MWRTYLYKEEYNERLGWWYIYLLRMRPLALKTLTVERNRKVVRLKA